jgi:hypothetical protein
MHLLVLGGAGTEPVLGIGQGLGPLGRVARRDYAGFPGGPAPLRGEGPKEPGPCPKGPQSCPKLLLWDPGIP